MSRRASRILVIGGIVFAILFAVYTTIMINRTSDDPAVREAVEEFERQERDRSASQVDTTAATSPNY